MLDRRDFLRRALQFSAAGLLVPTFLRGENLLWPSVARGAGGRLSVDSPFAGKILVWINLNGGNDGLNAAVPYTSAAYYGLRPNLAIPPGQVSPLSGTLGLHPSLSGLASLYGAGQLAVIQGVGYPNMNLSHFRGTDIWFSGSDEDVILETGWLARFIESVYTDFPYLVPDSPYGVQQGAHRLPLTGARGLTGVVVDDPSSFLYIVSEGYTGEWVDPLPATHGGDELAYVRRLDADTFAYAGAIQEASDAGSNTVAYPQTSLGSQLSIIARLISGGLATPCFLASEYGFDTHAYQADPHASLLSSVGGSTAAFWQDLANLGLQDRVLVMTTSEFGRRPEENGSIGTDHGTSAPHFVLGTRVNGGIYGVNPNVQDLDGAGNLLVQHDFRSVYSTVLRNHFGQGSSLVDGVLLGSFGDLGFLDTVTDVPPPATQPQFGDRLHLPQPNPVSLRSGGAVQLRFELRASAPVTLDLFDLQGRRIARLAQGTHSAGPHELTWAPRGLAAGSYLARLTTPSARRTAKIIVLP